MLDNKYKQNEMIVIDSYCDVGQESENKSNYGMIGSVLMVNIEE